MAEAVSRKLNVRVQWPASQTVPLLATQFAAQVTPAEEDVPGSMILTLGYVGPPILSGEPEEQEEQARQITSLDVVQVGKFILTKRGTRELLAILHQSVARWDEMDVEGHQGEEAAP